MFRKRELLPELVTGYANNFLDFGICINCKLPSRVSEGKIKFSFTVKSNTTIIAIVIIIEIIS